MGVSVSRILTLLWVVLLPDACDGHGDSRDLVVRYLSGGKLWLNDEALGENVLRARVQADLSRRAEKLLWVAVDEHVLYGEAVGVMAKLSRDNPAFTLHSQRKRKLVPSIPQTPNLRRQSLMENLGFSAYVFRLP
jgi:biopolymer transport protein ExbD